MWRDVFGVWYSVTFEELEDAIRRCPDDLWLASMWSVADDPDHGRAVVADGSPHPLGDEALSAVWKVAWHGLGANEFNLNGRAEGFRTTFKSPSPAWTAADAVGVVSATGRGQVLPTVVPTRDEALAYLEHNRRLANTYLDLAREVGEGQSTLGPWRGPTSVLLSMFHGNACHLVSHSTEVTMFVNQHR
jgi:hypothetical protein